MGGPLLTRLMRAYNINYNRTKYNEQKPFEYNEQTNKQAGTQRDTHNPNTIRKSIAWNWFVKVVDGLQPPPRWRAGRHTIAAICEALSCPAAYI